MVPKTQTMHVSRRSRTVGLDKPCRVCGKPVHYSYAALMDGMCGSCADKGRPKKPQLRPYHRATVLQRGEPGQPASATAVAVKICVAIVIGVVAVMAVLRMLLG